MNKLNKLLQQIKSKPESVEFQNIIDTINEFYNYTATQFSNGPTDDCVISKAGENEGSCKIFAFALLHQLDENQTLNCFGQYYRNDVLNHPDNTDHANIRTFMRYGWKNIVFDNVALISKAH
ncbi:MAG: HopJ type III effector protein [Gammaproteobacteria bacterium]